MFRRQTNSFIENSMEAGILLCGIGTYIVLNYIVFITLCFVHFYYFLVVIINKVSKIKR